ncbi:alcohol dehydrogenase catalytic domain-containing protein [Streptomyces lincolnensis]|uniref:alcohol dehydrogenase catalytic domain-containing protein n=1 Tax=Streptomyces lincolnensis TaxID=1915 RepID=UPI0037D60F99
MYGEPPFTLGSDVSGVVVEEVGAEVTGLRPGDEVFGRVDGGGYAVHLTAPARHFAVKPAKAEGRAGCPAPRDARPEVSPCAGTGSRSARPGSP